MRFAEHNEWAVSLPLWPLGWTFPLSSLVRSFSNSSPYLTYPNLPGGCLQIMRSAWCSFDAAFWMPCWGKVSVSGVHVSVEDGYSSNLDALYNEGSELQQPLLSSVKWPWETQFGASSFTSFLGGAAPTHLRRRRSLTSSALRVGARRSDNLSSRHAHASSVRNLCCKQIARRHGRKERRRQEWLGLTRSKQRINVGRAIHTERGVRVASSGANKRGGSFCQNSTRKV